MTGVVTQPQRAPEVEFCFDFGRQLQLPERHADRRGAATARRPDCLEAISSGANLSGFGDGELALRAAKGEGPGVFPRLGVLPLRIALLGVDQPWIGAFCRKVMELNFVHDQDINQREQMAPVVAELGLSALGLMDRAQSEPIKTRLREQTEQARAKGIFGAPTFFVGTEMFWGNDRLDDALLLATEQKA